MSSANKTWEEMIFVNVNKWKLLCLCFVLIDTYHFLQMLFFSLKDTYKLWWIWPPGLWEFVARHTYIVLWEWTCRPIAILTWLHYGILKNSRKIFCRRQKIPEFWSTAKKTTDFLPKLKNIEGTNKENPKMSTYF